MNFFVFELTDLKFNVLKSFDRVLKLTPIVCFDTFEIFVVVAVVDHGLVCFNRVDIFITNI